MKKTLLMLSTLTLPFASTAGPLNQIQGGVINGDLTLNVPTEYSTVQEALQSLAGKAITTGNFVTIQVADGVYSNYDTIEVTNPYASQIKLLGNTSNPAAVEFQFQSGVQGILVRSGTSLGEIGGFKLTGNYATDGASVNGVYATQNASVTCTYPVIAENFWGGFRANFHSQIICGNAEAHNNRFGFNADIGSSVHVPNSVANNNFQGYSSNQNSMLNANDSVSTNNTQFGLTVYEGGIIDARGISVSGNGTNYNTQDSVSYIRLN